MRSTIADAGRCYQCLVHGVQNDVNHSVTPFEDEFERAAKGVAVPEAGPGALEVGGEHIQLAFRPPRLQIHASDQALAGEHRHAVIRVAAPARRLVDLYPLLAAEQGLHSRPIPEQRIEGGQQDAAVTARPHAFQLGQAFQILDPDPAGERPSCGAQRAREDSAGLPPRRRSAERSGPAAPRPMSSCRRCEAERARTGLVAAGRWW